MWLAQYYTLLTFCINHVIYYALNFVVGLNIGVKLEDMLLKGDIIHFEWFESFICEPHTRVPCISQCEDWRVWETGLGIETFIPCLVSVKCKILCSLSFTIINFVTLIFYACIKAWKEERSSPFYFSFVRILFYNFTIVC